MYRLSLIISEIYNKYLPLAEKDGIILNLDFSDTTKEISDPERVKQYLDSSLNSSLKRSDKGEVTISVDKTSIAITDTGTTLSHSACALLSNRYIDVSSRVGFGTTVRIFLQPREVPAEKPPLPQLKVEGISAGIVADSTTGAPQVSSEVKLAAKQGKQKLGFGARLQLKGKKSDQQTNKAPAVGSAKTSQVATKSSSTSKTQKSLKASKPAKKLTLRAKGKNIKSKKTNTNKSSTTVTRKITAKASQRQLAAAARKADKEVKRIAKKASKQAKTARKTSKTNSATKATPKLKKKSVKKRLELS